MGFNRNMFKPSLGNVGVVGNGLLSETSKKEKKSYIKKTVNVKLDFIYDNEKNKYSQTDIESLAESIRMIGLQENLVAIRINDEHYILTAGHRRLKALKMLQKDGYWGDYAPVVVMELSDIDLDIADDKKEMLMIIATNKERRINSEVDTLMEVKEYTAIIDELRKKGYKNVYGQTIEGVKTRDLVAENFGMSNQTARRHMTVAKNASDSVMDAIANGELSVSAASEIVNETKEVQDAIVGKVNSEKAQTGKPANSNSFKKAREAVKNQSYVHGGIEQWEADTADIREAMKSKGYISFNESEMRTYNKAIDMLTKVFCK